MSIPIEDLDNPPIKTLNDVKAREGVVCLTDAMRHQLHLGICECPHCKGTVDRNRLCTPHLFSDHFLTTGRCPPLVATRLQAEIDARTK